MRALVIGADGFAGRWLARHLAESGDVVHGIVGPHFRPPLASCSATYQVDVRDREPIAEIVRAVEPEAAYYLAGVSQAGIRDDLSLAAGTAVVGATNALVACAELAALPRFLLVSSSHAYGAEADQPLDEGTPLRPATVYGAAKAASEAAARLLADVVGLPLLIARPFNHIGPGQRDDFVLPSLIARVLALPSAATAQLALDSAHTVRDFTDVRDVVRAYRTLVVAGEAGGVYNVCSGIGTSVRELAELVLEIAGVSARITDHPNGGTRSSEPLRLVGDPARLRGLGWEREHELRGTVKDVLASVRG